MDPNLDDPNNHVPPVAPDDDWGDLDEIQRRPAPGLPTLKSQHGILPRKAAGKLHVNHHAPKPKSYVSQSHSPPGQKIAKEEAPSVPAESEFPQATAGDPVPETASAGDGAGEVTRISLPEAPGGKRGRVKEIGTTQEAAPQRAAVKYPHAGDGAKRKGSRIPGKKRVLLSRRRKSEWGEKSASGSFRWMLYTGVGVIALIVVAVVLNRPAAGVNIREQSMFSQMKPEKTDLEVREDDSDMMVMLTDVQEEAKRIFATYATAGSTADFMASVYRAEETAGIIEERWVPMGAKPGWKPNDLAVWTVRQYEGRHYGTLEGSLPDFSTFRAFFRQDAEGLKMDWKATVGYGSSNFADLKKGQGNGSEVRLLLSPADFYTFPLPEGEFRAFRLSSPDREETLWGYVKVGGELDAKLIAEFIPSQITGEAPAEVAVILGIERGPTESLPNQWMITKLVRLNWLDE